MCLSSKTAWELSTESPRCNSVEAVFASVHEVSLLKATNPPSAKGTTNWCFAASWAVANVARASRQSIMARALLLIAVAPFNDRQLNLVRRFETDQTERCRLITPRGNCVCFGAGSLPAISFAIDDPSDNSFPDGSLRHEDLDRLGHDNWRWRVCGTTRIQREGK